MAKLKIFPFLRISFHLILASLAMTIAIYYCTNLASLLMRHDEDAGLAIIGLICSYFIQSLFFYVFVGKWIVRNFSAILWIYCIFSLLLAFGDLINHTTLSNVHFKSLTELIIVYFANFMMWLIQLLPLISLVATPTFVISSIFLSSFASRKRGAYEKLY